MTRARIAPLVVLALLGAGAIVLALAARETGEVVEEQRAERAAQADASVEADAGAPLGADAAVARHGAPADEDYQCIVPALAIPRDPRCAEGAPYPDCRWQLPDDEAAAGLYVVWRSTTPEHRWARPGLVTLVLAAAREYQRRWPGEHLTIGDLDAAGPRHQTHDRGVDVDLYLEQAMLDVNAGPHQYLDNYAGRSPEEVAELRARVTDLAHILATCSRGRLRIYYNDPEVLRPFRAWFDAHGFVSDVGPAMTMHNRLHRFHFHMTVPEDLAPLDVPAEGP
ncbi:MAG: hypothetical protein U0234_18990 [Sandaracinus sp.]